MDVYGGRFGKTERIRGRSAKTICWAVVVRDGILVGSGYRGTTASGHHAEFGVLQGISPELLEGAAVFSTLEPCTNRNHPKGVLTVRAAKRRAGPAFCALSAASATLEPIDPLPSLSTMLKWEGPFSF